MDRFCIECGLAFAASGGEARCLECAAPADEELVSAPEMAIDGSAVEVPVSADTARAFPTSESVPDGWEPTPGDLLLGLYEVRGELGRGGMGAVHRVRHRGWDLWECQLDLAPL